MLLLASTYHIYYFGCTSFGLTDAYINEIGPILLVYLPSTLLTVLNHDQIKVNASSVTVST